MFSQSHVICENFTYITDNKIESQKTVYLSQVSKIDVITFPNNIVKEIKFFSVEETAPCIEIYLQTTEAILYGNPKNT